MDVWIIVEYDTAVSLFSLALASPMKTQRNPARFKMPPSILTCERMALSAELGIEVNRTPTAWRDSSDPEKFVKERRALSTSKQSKHSLGLCKPKRVKQKVQNTGASKNALELALLPHEGEPGPADYNLRDAVKMSGGHFSKAHVKSELELLQ